jgi:hypothetical protein
MTKTKADTKSVADYFEKKVKKIGTITLDDIFFSSSGIELVFERQLNTVQKKKIKDGVLEILQENFYGTYELGDIEVDRFESLLKIKVSQSGVAGSVPTAMQEAGSAFILTQVLKRNKKFESASDILNDVETKKGLDKIFKPPYSDSINEWTHSYFEHQNAFFKKFQPTQWKIFEHGGQDFMSFIKERAQLIKEVTPSGKLKDVGKYETWNPSDIWAVENKDQVKKKIDEAIQKDGSQTLTELNNVLLSLMKDNKLVGLSLKKIEPKEKANFAYVNKDPKSIEFAQVEEVKMNDITIEIKTEETIDGMSQGGYILFGKYTINVIRTPGSGFSNLKYESVVKGSGGRGGAAPVDLVANMLKSRIPTHTFVNRHQDYPETAEDFKNDTKNYEAMYNKLKSKISGTKDYSEFRSRILSMYRSNNKKSMAVAQSKLMQLNFFSDVLSANRNKPEEFWTDLLYLSLKVGKRFAPHGKLA